MLLFMKLFEVKILITSDAWDYKQGDTFTLIVPARNYRSAMTKVYNKLSGSEYPNYRICGQPKECDTFLFNPRKFIYQKKLNYDSIDRIFR